MASTSHLLKTIAVIGYGPQGRAISMNLRDSGYEVIVGLREGSPSRKKASDDRFPSVLTIDQAVKSSDTVCFAFPDHHHPLTWKESIAPHLREGQVLWFLHGTSIHFRFIEPPGDVDVVMVAPHAPGNAVREKFALEHDLSAFVAVHQDATGKAMARARQLANGCGFDDERLIVTTFEQEAIGDLFGEQVVLCGGLAALIHGGFETLIEKGHDPDHAYLEVAYQLDLIVALIKQHGIAGMLDRISVAARYGAVTAGPVIIDEAVRRRMRERYDAIASGNFPEELTNLSDKEIASLSERYSRLTSDLFEEAAKRFSPGKN